jgi:hypothetical protein
MIDADRERVHPGVFEQLLDDAGRALDNFARRDSHLGNASLEEGT